MHLPTEGTKKLINIKKTFIRFRCGMLKRQRVFFTCVKCFDDSSFYVCPDCYGHSLYQHDATHRQFLDSFALLTLKRTAPPKPSSCCPTGKLVEVEDTGSNKTPSSTSPALVLMDPKLRRMYKWRDALQIVGAGIHVAKIASYLCNIM